MTQTRKPAVKIKTVKAPKEKTGKISNPHLPDPKTQLETMNDDRQYGSGQRNMKSSLPRGVRQKTKKTATVPKAAAAKKPKKR